MLTNPLYLDDERINEIRSKYALEPLTVSNENVENKVEAFPLESYADVDVKLKCEINVESEDDASQRLTPPLNPSKKKNLSKTKRKPKKRNSEETSEDSDREGGDLIDFDIKKEKTHDEWKIDENEKDRYSNLQKKTDQILP
jgi:hypothetical protein